MPEHLYILSLVLLLGSIVLVFALRYASAATQAKARYASGEAYRQLAETSVAAQAAAAGSLAAVETTLAEVRTRLAAIEKILKDVE